MAKTTRSPSPPLPPEVRKKDNNTYRARKAKDASQQKAVDDITDELASEQDRTVVLEQEIEDLKKERNALKRQLESMNTERVATVTIDVMNNVEVELDGSWKVGDIRRVSRCMVMAIRRKIRQESRPVKTSNVNTNSNQLN